MKRDQAPPNVPVAGDSWRDTRTGITEEATFLEVEGARIIAFLHLPRGRAQVGVLICSSLYEDLQVNYRRELLLARELAGRGFAVARFHYRGSGNSDGLASGAATLASLVQDALAAEAWLRQRADVTEVVFFGARLGALVCAHLADRSGYANTILSAPALSGEEYFRGMSRAGRVAGVRAQRASPQPVGLSAGPDAPANFTEMLGNRVYRESLDDLQPRKLELASAEGRQVLIVQIAASEALSKPLERLTQQLREGGAEVQVILVQARQIWFVPDTWEPEDEKPELRTLVSGISDWVEKVAESSR